MKQSLLNKYRITLIVLSILIALLPLSMLRSYHANKEDIDRGYTNYVNLEAIKYMNVATSDGVSLYSHDSKKDHPYAEDATVREAFFSLLGTTNSGVAHSILSNAESELAGDNKTNRFFHPQNIKLTIDSRLQTAAYKTLCAAKSKGGVILVANYKTGEVLCAATAPGLDPMHPENPPEASYLFKPICAFTPGSVMKTISIAALLETNYDKAMKFQYHCTGKDGHLKCVKVHGDVDLANALHSSCNCGVATAVTGNVKATTYDKFIKKINLLDKDAQIADFSCRDTGIVKASGKNSDYKWTVNGQSSDLITPVALLRWYSALANDGISVPLHLNTATSVTEETLVSSRTATFIQNALVTDKLPVHAWGKTGTAQQVSSDSKTKVAAHSWYICALDDKKAAPLCCVVMLQNGGASKNASDTCFKFINDYIL